VPNGPDKDNKMHATVSNPNRINNVLRRGDVPKREIITLNFGKNNFWLKF